MVICGRSVIFENNMIPVFRELQHFPLFLFLRGWGAQLSKSGGEKQCRNSFGDFCLYSFQKKMICRKCSILFDEPWGFFGETGNFLPCKVNNGNNTFSKASLSCLHNSRRLSGARFHVFSRLRCKPTHHTQLFRSSFDCVFLCIFLGYTVNQAVVLIYKPLP